MTTITPPLIVSLDHNNAYHSVNFRFLRYFPESGVEGGVECK